MMNTLPASQPSWRRMLRTLVQLRPVVALFWTLCGGTIMLFSGRLFLVENIKAETRSRTVNDSMLAVRAFQLAAAVDSLRDNGRISTRSICLDHTQAEQAIIEVKCPRYLYKGAK